MEPILATTLASSTSCASGRNRSRRSMEKYYSRNCGEVGEEVVVAAVVVAVVVVVVETIEVVLL